MKMTIQELKKIINNYLFNFSYNVIKKNIIFENFKAVSSDIMQKKIYEYINNWAPPPGWTIQFIDISSPQNTGIFLTIIIEGTRESYKDFSEKNEKDRLKNYFFDFASKRGWNLLRVINEPLPGRIPTMKLELLFDQQPNIQNTNYFGSVKDFQEQDIVLLHLTKKKYINSILKNGFRPSRMSTDGINFGNGRSYFIAVQGSDLINKKDLVLSWFKRAEESYEFAGIDSDEKKVLLKIDVNIIDKNIKFYIDTEFGDSSGIIGIDDINIGSAIWSPSHISGNAVKEIIEL